MWYPEWDILVVDDEPDVLKVTELVLRNMEVEGVPVRVHSASSKAEAMQVLQEQLSSEMGPSRLTVALIDIVMETDTAGLELCDYIRSTLQNNMAQIFIRTGQPGMAPERSVIDRYDITGYFTKVEATEDKLYTMIKSGVRQFTTSMFSMLNTMMLNDIIASSMVSQEQIAASLQEKLQSVAHKTAGDAAGVAIWIDDTPIISVGYDIEEANRRRAHLNSLPHVPLGATGDYFVADPETKDALMVAPGEDPYPTVSYLGSGYSLPVASIVYMLPVWTMRSLGMLWQQAEARSYA